jgi:hypothetical protein
MRRRLLFELQELQVLVWRGLQALPLELRTLQLALLEEAS